MQMSNSGPETTRCIGSDGDASKRAYEEQIHRLYAAINQILSNLLYIRDELPKVNTEADTRDAIRKMCDDFEWEILDIRMEVRRLEDNLGLHPGEAPFEHGMESDDPKETMGFIHDWLAAQLAAMHKLACSVHARAEQHPDAALVSILVAESARNIIHQAIEIQDALDGIAATVSLPSVRQSPLPQR